MSLALYLSRVRSSEVLGDRRHQAAVNLADANATPDSCAIPLNYRLARSTHLHLVIRLERRSQLFL
jgi:hypothetical protein